MKYQFIIFDLDGTILNTLEDLADSANAALLMNGYPQRTLEEIRTFVGNGIRNLIERCVPAGTKEASMLKVLSDFKQHYGIHCADKTKPYDGISNLLNTLRQAGYKMAVVSNKADFAVQDLCEQYFPAQFDFVIGEREGVRKKPAPDSVNEALRTLGFAKEQSVYVGDSEVDIATAQNAQIDHIIVDWGFRSREFLISQGAQVIISKPEELLSKI